MLAPLLSFEIFDDVAAFYFFTTVLGIVVVPRGSLMFRAWLERRGGPEPTGEHENPCTCELCLAKKARLAALARSRRNRSWLSFWNVLWLICAVSFLWCLANMRGMETREMATFDPYKILGLESGADLQKIKRAYRKQSLLYHPDKNPDDEEAAAKFVMLAKALQTLTDETTRENWEKYGNPDGYQGTSVTIGLPSILTEKSSEQLVLLVYLGFLVVLPVVVGIWWSRARRFHESGVMNMTLANMVNKVHENSTPRTMIDVLAMSAEYSHLCPREGVPQSEAEEVRRLLAKCTGEVPKGKGPVSYNYFARAMALLHAHINGEPVQPDAKKLAPEVRERLERDTGFILEKSPKLMDLMTELCSSREHLRATFAAVELSQHLAQGLPFHSSPLLQLPHVTQKDADLLAKKGGASSIRRMLELPASRRKKILRLGQSNGMPVAEWNEAASVAALFPKIDVQCRPHVVGADDQQIYEGDMVTLELRLRRSHLGALGFDARVGEDGNPASAAAAADDEDDENKAGDENDVSRRGADKRAKLELLGVDTSKPDDRGIKEDDPLNLRWRDFDPSKKKQLVRARQTDPGRIAHAPRFPVPRRETWYVVLVDLDLNRMSLSKVKHFDENGEETVEMPVGIPRGLKGKQRSFEVHVLCDSYLGCDVRGLSLKLDVGERSEEDKAALAAAEAEDAAHAAIEPEEEEEEEGVWYLFYCASVQELLLNIFLLTLLCMFLFNFLYAKGWLQSVARWTAPFTSAFRSFFTRYIYDFDAAEELL